MPIASIKPTVPVIKTETSTVTPTNYKSTIKDTLVTPVEALLGYISGSVWPITYYRQILGEHNNIRELDLASPSVYQNYEKIKLLDLRVSGALSSTYDSATGISTYNGTADVYPFIVPNTLDYFVADAGNTRLALFRVTNVDRKSVRRDSVFTIDYSMVGYVDAMPEFLEALEERITSELTFDRDRLINGNSPVLRNEVYDLLSKIKAHDESIVSYYFRQFFSTRYGSFVLPHAGTTIYDMYLNLFISKLVDSIDMENAAFLKAPVYDDDPISSQLQLWEVLIRREYNLLNECVDKMSCLSRRLFSKNPFLKGIFFSGINYIIYPATKDESLYGQYMLPPTTEVDLIASPREHRMMSQLPDYQYKLLNTTIPTIPQLDLEASYVLPKDFYSQVNNSSVLEILVRDYLKRQAIDTTMLERLCTDFTTWQRLEQFYYGPILMLLCKTVLREAY